MVLSSFDVLVNIDVWENDVFNADEPVVYFYVKTRD